MNKSSFRKFCMKKLTTASLNNKNYKEYMVNKQLKILLDEIKPTSILFYIPLGFEVDISKLLKDTNKTLTKCYTPYMFEKSFKLVPYRLPFNIRKFNIRESNDTHQNIKNIDVAIIPVLGIDSDIKRIGFGKGMYDRFFPTLKRKPITIFIQLDECISNEKITDHYDIQGDIYITPKSIKYRNIKHKFLSLRKWELQRMTNKYKKLYLKNIKNQSRKF